MSVVVWRFAEGSWDGRCRACRWGVTDAATREQAIELGEAHERECPAEHPAGGELRHVGRLGPSS